MKTLKYFFSALLIIAAVSSCVDDEMGDIGFVETVVAPTNISALFNISQDNTGTVTITPNGEGPVSYDIYLGDDTIEPELVLQGDNIVHIYAEGIYTVRIVAVGITGLETEFSQEINVSFNAPENLEVTIENDAAISKQVNVTATADFAMTFDVYFGEDPDDEPVEANIGETASFIYQEAGIYTIRVVAKGGAIETTEYEVEFEVTAILQPLTSAPTPPARQEVDYVSIFSDTYTNIDGTDYNPDWGQSGQGSSYAMFDLNGDAMLNYINLSYQGIALADGTSADVSMMEFMHIDVWTAEASDIEISLIQPGPVEAPVSKPLVVDEWNSFDIPLSDYLDQGLTLQELIQLKLVGTPWAAGTVFVDNIYFYRAPTSSGPSVLEGTWKMAAEAGSLMVGPSPGNGDWWSIDAAGVAERACYYDDTYVFGADGSFSNVLGSESWIEGWQGGTDACGTPVAPHDGSGVATFTHDDVAGTVTLNGVGVYLGLAKANNAGELPNVAVPSSIVYDIVLSNNDNTLTVTIEAGAGVFWTYKLVRDGVVAPPPLIAGTWKMAAEAGSLMVGPSPGNGDWWSIDAAGVAERACYYDDTFVFGADGSFSNVLGSESWIEGWQGGTEACGTPVAPHDGSGMATYTYSGSTVTVNGVGAYLGLAKVNNDGELPNVAVPSSITYDSTLSDNDNTMTLSIEAGAGVFWTFKLIREGTGGGGTYDLTLPIDFENTGFGASWTWNVFENDTNLPLEFVANPNASGINTSSSVAKITALQTGQPWVGTETAHGEMGITWDLSTSNAVIRIMVYKTVISDVGIKLVNPAGGAQEEIKVSNTVINQWEELTFDFSGRIGNGLDGSTNIDQIVVFPDFDLGGRTSDNVVYFDNITFGN